MKLTLPILLNGILLIFPCFLAVYALTLFLTVNNALRIVCSIVIALSVSGAFTTFSLHRNEKKSAYKSIIDEDEAKLCSLPLLSSAQITEIFSKLFEELNIPFTQKCDYFILKKTVLFYPILLSEALSKNEIILALRKVSEDFDEYVIVSSEFSAEAYELELYQNITLITTSSIYPMIKESIPKKPRRVEKLTLFKLQNLLKKTNANKYLFLGALTLLSSFIVTYPTYYIISGSLLVLFGLFVKFFGVSLKPKEKIESFLEKLVTKSEEKPSE